MAINPNEGILYPDFFILYELVEFLIAIDGQLLGKWDIGHDASMGGGGQACP